MKNIDFTRGLFLITSLFILAAGFLIPESNLMASVVGALIIVSLVVFDIQAPKIAKLSESNPKIKTMRFLNRLTIFFVTTFFIFAMLSPIENLLNSKTHEILIVGIVSIFIMIFGNLSPKIPFNRYLGLRLPWTIRDEDTWKIAHKILGYLASPVAIGMFASSFFFNIEKVSVTCILIWIIIPSIYSLIFYYKKIKA